MWFEAVVTAALQIRSRPEEKGASMGRPEGYPGQGKQYWLRDGIHSHLI
jgi:hypothetical protein